MKAPFDRAILPFSKFSGVTSFGALNQIKKALNTKKVGHTGTLDSFADGLLVAVVGKYTKLASYITDCNKEYLAVFKFGLQTDTLDPTGSIIKECKPPKYQAFLDILPDFIGKQSQVPPNYSAVHVNGRRASDVMRLGESVQLKPRDIEIFGIEILNAKIKSELNEKKSSILEEVVLKISCSKGTYIRTLAKDMAEACGSVAFVSKLRRTKVGCFDLLDSVGFNLLPEFDAENSDVLKVSISDDDFFSGCMSFSKEIAKNIGLNSLDLKPDFLDSFANGRFIKSFWFNKMNYHPLNGDYAVFCCNTFCGIIACTDEHYSYGTVFIERGSC